MDLWIKSQNKEKLCKIENIKYMDTSDDFEDDTHSLWNDNNGILGIYKTKERALEVLDEIQKFLENSYETYIQQHDNGLVSVVPVYHSRKIVFEMPKE